MVGRSIQEAREKAALSRAHLAAVLGVAVSTVWRWENDHVLPLRRLGDIADALHTTVTQLLGEDA